MGTFRTQVAPYALGALFGLMGAGAVMRCVTDAQPQPGAQLACVSGAGSARVLVPPSARAPGRERRAEPGTAAQQQLEQERARAISVVASVPQMQAYLDVLAQRARARGRVTALEVEPGAAVVERVTGDAEQVGAFYRRMEALQHELAPIAAPARAGAEGRAPLRSAQGSALAGAGER